MAHKYLQGCIDVVQIDERLTVDDVASIEPLLDAAIGSSLPQLVVDLRRVRLIDSAGLELLLETHQKCSNRGGSVYLAAPSPHVREVLRITGLDAQLLVHRDVVGAAGAFAV